ncbi:MAG: aspartate kinase [Anaerolineae bacterium]|nr:aspartate kinase [Anaerolineae bacterium]
MGNSKMIVHKFGGTSVGSAERIAAVADILLGAATAGTPVAVVSAMSGVTHQLITGARAAAAGEDVVHRNIKAALLRRHLDAAEALLDDNRERGDVAGFIEDQLHHLERLYRSIATLRELTPRGSDAVAAAGEQLSAALLAAHLRLRGVRAQALSATELIVTDAHFGGATPHMLRTRERLQARLLPLIQQGILPVVTGYIGATADGITTTLGRGGSDYSAAIVGAGLDADEVWIWSDVDGILTADPNITPRARTLTELSYAEAAELAYFGADVLHPRTIQPVIAQGIPLRILNSFNPSHPGTLILQTPPAERQRLPAIISTRGLTQVAIGSQDDAWTLELAARALHRLSAAGVDVLMFSQSFSEHSLNLVVREQDQAHCLHVLHETFGARLRDGAQAPRNARQGACTLGVKERVATISMVGAPGWQGSGTTSNGNGVAHTFAALGALGTRIIAVAQAGTETSVSFCIPEDALNETVRVLHRELGLEEG